MFNLVPFFISIVFGILAILTLVVLIGICEIIDEDGSEVTMSEIHGMWKQCKKK